MPSISVIIPVFRSQDSIALVVEQLAAVLPGIACDYEAVLVEDGGGDSSWHVIGELSEKYDWVRGYKLMRNYGQHNALLCGIRAARYEIIVTMDDDLQHPAESIADLVALVDNGWDVAYGTPERKQHNFLRNSSTRIVKLIMRSVMGVDLARGASPFRAFKRDLRDAFSDYSGPVVHIDALLAWGTTRFTAIPTPHNPRPIGRSNYTFGKLVNHALNTITGFSTAPLRFASILGFLMTSFGFLTFLYIMLSQLFIHQFEVPGFTFIASIISLFAGVQMFTLGVFGEYLARIHFRVMDKPTFVLEQTTESATERERQ